MRDVEGESRKRKNKGKTGVSITMGLGDLQQRLCVGDGLACLFAVENILKTRP